MNNSLKSSFRDNSGFIFQERNVFFRNVNISYKLNYDFLISSGLYKSLSDQRLLIPHQEISPDNFPIDCYKILLPEQLSFVSFPYSWSFGMLKDAAMLTLKIQKDCLIHGMTLKDANVYNIQFQNGSPIFIDTLSFEKYENGTHWKAYNQFCQHFLAPLALMSYADISLNQLLINNIDGIPLDLTTRLLPFKSKFNFGLYLHLFMHVKAQKRCKQNKATTKNNPSTKGSISSITQIIDSLISTVEGLKWNTQNTTWDKYYEKWVADSYFDVKKEIVQKFLMQIGNGLNQSLDLGSNDGTFSVLATKYYRQVLSFDIDPSCVEQNYQMVKKEKITNLLPLVVDFTNPAPSIGWNNEERTSILTRIGKVDTIMALAVVHHLCIGKNIPLDILADFLHNHCKNLIIEFVPKSDEKVQILLENREDIFDKYNVQDFKEIFSTYFDIMNEITLAPTERMLFLMKTKI